jgi:ferredoxin
MQTVLYYFTGTGNSLAIANDLARELNCPKPIPMAVSKEDVQTEAEVIGLIFPVYFLDMPELVKAFLKRLQINNPSAYIFAVTNCGGDAGNTLVNLERILIGKGNKLTAGFILKMPDNSIYFKTSDEVREAEFNHEKAMIKEIASTVRAKGVQSERNRFRIYYQAYSKFAAWYFRSALQANKKRVDGQSCNQCGLCVKICPVHNIQIKDAHVTWGSGCRECFACIHSCPNQAIRFGKLKVNRSTNYRHPEVTLEQIAEQSGERPHQFTANP